MDRPARWPHACWGHQRQQWTLAPQAELKQIDPCSVCRLVYITLESLVAVV